MELERRSLIIQILDGFSGQEILDEKSHVGRGTIMGVSNSVNVELKFSSKVNLENWKITWSGTDCSLLHHLSIVV